MTETPATEPTIPEMRDIITTATHLGAPVSAIPGTTATEVTVIEGSFDDVETSLGLYESHEAAVIALRNFVVARHDELPDVAPWATDLPTNAPTSEVHAARTAWLTTTSDTAIIDTMLGEGEYYFSEHRINTTPTRIR